MGNDSSGTYSIYKYHLKPEELETSDIKRTLPKIIITAGIHGEEKPPVDALYHMVYSLCNEWKNSPLLEYLRYNVELIIVPSVNPWGFVNGTRHNSNEVDVNRNFSERWRLGTVGEQTYGGEEPFSEVEAQYVKGILDENKDAIFYSDLHSAGSTYEDLMYHVVAMGEYYDENVEILAKYNIEQMTRELIKNYDLSESEGYFGFLDRTTIGGIAPLYTTSLGILSTSSECFYNLPGENSYSSNTLKACSEWLVNWVLAILKQTRFNYYN